MKLFLLSLFAILSCTEHDTHPIDDEITFVNLTSGWQYRFGDSPIDSTGHLIWLDDDFNSSEWVNIKSLREIPVEQHRKSMWLRIVLPNWKGANPTIYSGSVEQVMQVYLEDQKIYQYGKFISINDPHLMGRAVHLIQLPNNINGKLLTFRFYSDKHFIGFREPIILGSSFYITRELFRSNLDEIIFTIIYIISGIVLLIAFIFFRRDKLFLGMSIFLIPLGVWTGSNSVFLQIMLQKPYLFFLADVFSFYSFAVGAFYIIENIIEGKYKRIARFMWQFHILFIVTSIIMNSLLAITFASIFNIYIIGFFFSCMLGLIITILSAKKGNFETKLLLLGLGISFSFGILEIVLYDSKTWTYSPGCVHIGCIFFVISLIWILFYRYRRAYELKDLAQQQVLKSIEHEKNTRQKYTRKLLSVQEEECKKISFELHDSVGQDLLVVKNLIHFGKKNKINVIENDKYYETIFNSTSRAIEEVRDISRALHPVQLVNLGLTQAIKSMLNGFKDSTKIKFNTKIDNIDGFIKVENEIHIYRILQETLNNIIKHSQASMAKISVKNEGKVITISIEDNGKGFDTSIASQQSNGLGLSSLSERVGLLHGEISINSEINNGTEIIAKIPVKELTTEK